MPSQPRSERSIYERKYFLDWLRVIAFALLILFHIGMLYVTWDYNLKSERVFPEFELVMNSLSSWRLVLLFFISGVASRFLLKKLGVTGFAKDRLRRLLPVILLGMLLINPVQVYVEFLTKGYIEPGYLDFWLNAYLPGAPFPNRMLPTWDHLWFLVYLLFYALGLAAVFGVSKEGAEREVAFPLLLLLPCVWLCLGNVLVTEFNPVTHALVDDWANHVRWIGVFAAGVICAFQHSFWDKLRVHRARLAVVSLLLFTAQLANGMVFRSGQADPRFDGILYSLFSGTYGWSMVLTLSGYAAEYLNRSSRMLDYLTEAVLPIYVFHQPILLVFAYLVFPISLPLPLEVAMLIAGTALGSVAAYEAFSRRTRILRFLSGLKPVQK